MSTADDTLAVVTVRMPTPDCVAVCIVGELDACSAPQVELEIQSLLPPDGHKLILDLAEVAFIDSTGIRLLVQLMDQRQYAKEVVIINPRAITARRALEIVGLARLVRVVEDQDTAVACLMR